jgi:hypothetical protein
MRWVWLIALAGCQITPQEQLVDDCLILCRCESPLPSEQAACEKKCDVLPPVSDACSQCVEANNTRCDKLIANCDAVCQQQNPPTPAEEP